MNAGSRPWWSHPTTQGIVLIWLLFGGLTLTERFDLSLFLDNYFMSLTMVAGSLIAGATSEGGGAVAFPVMTLVFEIHPAIARDFSLMIQSVGMIAAGWTIWRLGIPIERRAIVWSGLGGVLGIVIGISLIAPLLIPAAAKLFFVTLWLSFGVALVCLNAMRGRVVRQRIEGFSPRHRVLLFGVGLIGGAVAGVTGSGIDVLTFSLLTLGFAVCEKVATPTSVILMGINAMTGFAWRGTIAQNTLGPIDPSAWNFWYCCIPIVVIGAPMGARLITRISPRGIVGLLVVSIVVQFVGALLIVPMTGTLWALVGATLVFGLTVFGSMAWFGSLKAARG